jgi:hypothetical protein
MNKEEVGINRVGSKVVGFVSVDEPLLDAVDYAADHMGGEILNLRRKSLNTETAPVVTSLLFLLLKM